MRPGRAAAHGVNEAAWAAAYMKANAPQQWLGMTSVAGPTEAWFLSGYPSYEAFQGSGRGEMDLTFYFCYPRKSLAEIDKSNPMHVADAYRDAVGETAVSSSARCSSDPSSRRTP